MNAGQDAASRVRTVVPARIILQPPQRVCVLGNRKKWVTFDPWEDEVSSLLLIPTSSAEVQMRCWQPEHFVSSVEQAQFWEVGTL